MTKDSPLHYQASIEPIDLIDAFQLNFNEGNVIKYVARARRKGERLADLKKALWYLSREVERADD
jgi:hypothetical protein